jgi:FeoB-associated Cys-rich membrane protein
MSWQMPLVAMIVLAAVAYLARRTWRGLTGRKAGGCGGGCGCAATTKAPEDEGTFIPAGQLTVRRRDGEGRSRGG